MFDANLDPARIRHERAQLDELRRSNRLSADALNRIFATDYLARHRYNVNADTAHTLLFNLDSVLVDVSIYAHEIWCEIAEVNGLPFPTKENLRRHIDRTPAVLMNTVFQWGLHPAGLQELASYYDEALLDVSMGKLIRIPCVISALQVFNTTERIPIEPGAAGLLSVAYNAGMTLGAYTSMNQEQAKLLLDKSVLNRVISDVATREDSTGARVSD
jgi:phosphoglycolate phosphatase-like HAD superfamily hydrolase